MWLLCVCIELIHLAKVQEFVSVFTVTLRNPMAKFLSISRASWLAGTFGRWFIGMQTQTIAGAWIGDVNGQLMLAWREDCARICCDLEICWAVFHLTSRGFLTISHSEEASNHISFRGGMGNALNVGGHSPQPLLKVGESTEKWATSAFGFQGWGAGISNAPSETAVAP